MVVTSIRCCGTSKGSSIAFQSQPCYVGEEDGPNSSIVQFMAFLSPDSPFIFYICQEGSLENITLS